MTKPLNHSTGPREEPCATDPAASPAVRLTASMLGAPRLEAGWGVFDALPTAVCVFDEAGRLTYFNRAANALMGSGALIGSADWCRNWIFFDGEGRPIRGKGCTVAAVVTSGRAADVREAAARGVDGARVWVRVDVSAIADESGRAVGGVAVLTDITEMKRAEADRAHLAAIVESSEDAIATKDLNGVIRSWNRGAERLFGYTAEEVIGRSVTILMPPDRVDEEPGILRRIRRGERVEHYETVRRHKDGTLLDISLTVSPIKNARGMVVGASKVARDITRRKQVERALRDSEALHRQTLSLMPTAVYSCDSSGRLTYYNERAAELWGCSPPIGGQERLFCGSEQLLLPDGSPLAHDRCPTALALREGRSFRDVEIQIRRPDGSIVQIMASVDPVHDEQGGVIGAINAFHDVTAIRAAERALRESEARFRTMAENIPQLAWMGHPDGHLYWYNRRWYEYTGTSPETQEGWGWRSVHHPDHVDSVVNKWRAALQKGEPWEDTFPLRGKDGRYRWFLSRAQPIRNERGEIVRWFGTNTDVTAQREAERELRRHRDSLQQMVEERTEEILKSQERARIAERLASLGTLSAGLGHDMGNLLLPISIHLETLRSMGLPDGAESELDGIQSSLEYLRQLASGLRQLAVDPDRSDAKEPTELSAWWSEASTVLKNVLPRGVHLECSPPESEHWVAMPRAALTQVIFNLVQNAGDALRSRGSGTVGVDWGSGPDGVLIRVSDDGPGMNEEARARCMEPFYTTKARGVSTGLGLALVFGLVQEAGGAVELETSPGEGATFTVSLPSARDPAGTLTAARTAGVRLRDVRLRAVVTAELSSLGYDVREGMDSAPGADVIVEGRASENGRVQEEIVILSTSADGSVTEESLGTAPRVRTIRRALQNLASGGASREAES